MRNVIFAINITLDGCVDHTKFNPAEETFEYFMRLLRDDAGVLVYGRKTYQLFADGTIPAAFKMTESTVTSKGVIIVNYERAGAVPTGSV